jgi:hypothetical protein
VRRVAVVECDANLVAGALDSRENVPASRGIDGHGLLRNDIAAGLEGADDVDVVRAVNGRDDDLVGLGLGDHAVKVGGEERRDLIVA